MKTREFIIQMYDTYMRNYQIHILKHDGITEF